MAEPDWIALAKIVSTRITNRKDVEWKLALQHYGALGACLYAVANYMKPPTPKLPRDFLFFATIMIVVSFMLSVLWIWLIEKAHSFDALMYRSYMDRAKRIKSDSVSKAKEAELTSESIATHCPCVCQIWKCVLRQLQLLGCDQWLWFCVHCFFSILVHLAVYAGLCGITQN